MWETAAVGDPDECARVGALAHEMEPDKYPYTHLTSVTTANYVAGNPLYDILHDGRTVFDGPPLLSLKTWSEAYPGDQNLVEWHVDMPALTSSTGNWGPHHFRYMRVFRGALPNLERGNFMFANGLLDTWDVELPSLKDCGHMFEGLTLLTEWHTDMPALTTNDWSFHSCNKLSSYKGDLGRLQNGVAMFIACQNLKSFSSALPSLTNGNGMFNGCKLNRESVQTIARTIKDNNSMATPPTLTLGMAKGLKGQVDAELALIRAKGWNLTPQYN